jgi:hypothetical protein
VIAPDVKIAEEFRGIGSVVSVASLGEGCSSTISVRGHDAQIGDFAQLCPACACRAGAWSARARCWHARGTIPLKRVGAWATLARAAWRSKM